MAPYTWDQVVVDPSELGADPTTGPALVQAFVQWQLAHWPRLAQATEALAKVETRALRIGGPDRDRELLLQWNPGRAVSSTAKVDPASVSQRPCFLCAGNIPPEERGLAFGDGWVVLPNPAPILDGHIVIAHRDHVPQVVGPALGGLVAFAGAMRGTRTALYNGPRSGASAPDHLHLQAVSADVLPEERFVRAALARGEVPGAVLARGPGLSVWSARGAGRAILGAAGAPDEVEGAGRAIIAVLAAAFDADEPPLNLLATARPGAGPDGADELVLLVFPRGAHRPACFFAEGPAQRVVSPGIIDMAGIVVTVREQDFRVLDRATLEGIFGEVTVTGPRWSAIEAAVAARLGGA